MWLMNSIVSINVHLAKLVGEFSFIKGGHGFNSLEQQYFLNFIIELGSELGSKANLFAQDAGLTSTCSPIIMLYI